MHRLRRVLQRGLEGMVVGLMAGLAIVVVMAVIFRKFGVALVWYDEVASVMLAWLTYYGAALAALHHRHIGFPRFVQNARPSVRRALILTRSTIVVGFFLVVTWAGWEVLQVLGGLNLTSLPWVPARLSQSVIPIGGVLFMAAELLAAAERLRDPHAA